MARFRALVALVVPEVPVVLRAEPNVIPALTVAQEVGAARTKVAMAVLANIREKAKRTARPGWKKPLRNRLVASMKSLPKSSVKFLQSDATPKDSVVVRLVVPAADASVLANRAAEAAVVELALVAEAQRDQLPGRRMPGKRRLAG